MKSCQQFGLHSLIRSFEEEKEKKKKTPELLVERSKWSCRFAVPDSIMR